MKKRRPMSKRMAKKLAAGVLSLEQFATLVENQFDANEYLAEMVPDRVERKMVIDAAEEYCQQMFEFAGSELVSRIVGSDVE